MSPHPATVRPKWLAFLFDNSLFLIAGAILALVWANLDAASYHAVFDFDIGHWLRSSFGTHDTRHAAAGAAQAAVEHHGHALTVAFLINDILMAIFFALAAKEVWEAMLPGGALSNARRAATPLVATAGGIVGPALVYLLATVVSGQSGWFGQEGVLARGWAIPCATDIAFSYLIARLIFGPGHPAIAFLLLLAIADDAAGLAILAVAYPQAPLRPAWLLLTLVAIGIALLFRRLRLHSSWWYLLIPGVLSWLSFYYCGIHAALGLVPLIPCLPHAHSDLGIYAREELRRRDTLSEFEYRWKPPVEIFLGLFGLANAGVVLGNVGAATACVLLGLLLGKPVGITAFTWLAAKCFGLQVPDGMTYRHILTLGMVAGIGFTVALFMADAAFPDDQFAGDLRDSVKMGALASFLAAVLALLLARGLGIRPLSAAAESSTQRAE